MNEMTLSSHSIVSQNIRTHCLSGGEGSPVLFVHGNPDSSELWVPLMETLHQHHRCIAPDLPGFGESDSPADPRLHCTLDQMADWLDGVVDAMGVTEPVDLVVHDVGGFYGLAWLARRPERVRRVVITNTLFHKHYRWHFWGRVWRAPVLGEIAMAVMSIPGLGPVMAAPTIRLGGPLLNKEWVRHSSRAFRSKKTSAQVLALYRAMDPEKFGQYEEQMRFEVASRPSLVLWGDKDIFIRKEFAEQFGAQEVRHFPDAGHWLAREKTADVGRLMASFFGSGAGGL